jgi:hypothetical protein
MLAVHAIYLNKVALFGELVASHAKHRRMTHMSLVLEQPRVVTEA